MRGLYWPSYDPRMLHPSVVVLLVLLSAGCASSAGTEVTFLAPDAATVRALAFGPVDAEAAVVLVGGPEDRPSAWEELADRLAEEGWRVLAIGVRESDDPRETSRDVQGALAHLAGRRVAVVGTGEGVGAAIWAASGDEPAGVVVVGANAVPGLAERMRRVEAPKFLAAALGDGEAVEVQRELTANAPPPVESRVYPGDRTGLGMVGDEQVLADILAFLRRVLEVP